MRYNGTNFILQGKGGGGDATAAQLLSNAKATVDSGPIVGTMPNNGPLGGSLGVNGSYNIPAGYTTGGVVSQTVATKAYAEITPGTSNQVIGANQWLTGDQTVLGDGNLAASNIASGKTIFGITGSAPVVTKITGTGSRVTSSIPIRMVCMRGSSWGYIDCVNPDGNSSPSYLMDSAGEYRSFCASGTTNLDMTFVTKTGSQSGGLGGTITWTAYCWD